MKPSSFSGTCSSDTQPPSSLSSFRQHSPPFFAGVLTGFAVGTVLGAVLAVTNESKSTVPVVASVAECRKKLAENLGHVFASERAVYGNFSPAGEGQTVEVAARVGGVLCRARLTLEETLTYGDSEGVPEDGE